MKRKINFLFTLFIVCNTLCFSEEIKYRVKQDLFCYDYNSELPVRINKDSIISHEMKDHSEYYMSFFLNPDNEKSKINCKYNNYDFFIETEYIELLNSEKLFSENEEFLYIPDYYYEFINNKSFQFLLDKEEFWKKTKKSGMMEQSHFMTVHFMMNIDYLISI